MFDTPTNIQNKDEPREDFFFVPGADYSPASGKEEQHKWAMANEPGYKDKFEFDKFEAELANDRIEPNYFEFDAFTTIPHMLGSVIGLKGIKNLVGQTDEAL